MVSDVGREVSGAQLWREVKSVGAEMRDVLLEPAGTTHLEQLAELVQLWALMRLGRRYGRRAFVLGFVWTSCTALRAEVRRQRIAKAAG